MVCPSNRLICMENPPWMAYCSLLIIDELNRFGAPVDHMNTIFIKKIWIWCCCYTNPKGTQIFQMCQRKNKKREVTRHDKSKSGCPKSFHNVTVDGVIYLRLFFFYSYWKLYVLSSRFFTWIVEKMKSSFNLLWKFFLVVVNISTLRGILKNWYPNY